MASLIGPTVRRCWPSLADTDQLPTGSAGTADGGVHQRSAVRDLCNRRLCPASRSGAERRFFPPLKKRPGTPQPRGPGRRNQSTSRPGMPAAYGTGAQPEATHASRITSNTTSSRGLAALPDIDDGQRAFARAAHGAPVGIARRRSSRSSPSTRRSKDGKALLVAISGHHAGLRTAIAFPADHEPTRRTTRARWQQ